MRRFLIAAALVLAPVAASAALPPPYTANYEVRRNGEALGTATVTFKPLPNGRYNYRQKLAWKTRERSMQVNAAGNSIASTDKDKSFSPPYRAGVLDRNAITVALMADVAAGKAGDLEYFVPSHNDLETHVYRSASSEQIQTRLGAQRVIRVERIRESSNGRTTTLWLGQDRNFIPLRMLQKEPDGETIEMRITSIQ